MIEFPYRKNLWILDFVTTLFFAFVCAYIINTDSDLGNPNSRTHWDLVFLELSIYVFTFILAFFLQKRLVWIKSWAFISIFGPLIRSVILTTIFSPKVWEYEEKFSASHQEAVEKTSYWFVYGLLGNWFIFSIALMLFVLVVRFFAFVFLNIITYTSNQIKSFTDSKSGLNLK